MTTVIPRRPSAVLTPEQLEIFEAAWQWAESTTSVSVGSIHGRAHWRRVARLGLQIAETEGADTLVVALFAVCHDVARVHDGPDMEHGPKAAEMVATTLAPHLDLAPTQLDWLLQAIAQHTDGQISDDLTIGSCWDADRLDLLRIGFQVQSKLLSTAAARTVQMQDAAAALWARDRRIRRRAGLPIIDLSGNKEPR